MSAHIYEQVIIRPDLVYRALRLSLILGQRFLAGSKIQIGL